MDSHSSVTPWFSETEPEIDEKVLQIMGRVLWVLLDLSTSVLE